MTYRPNRAEREALSETRERFEDAREQMSRGYRHMRDMSPVEFWRDCRDRFDSIEGSGEETESWESNAYRPKTRNKTIATAASLLASGLGVDIVAHDPENVTDRGMSEVAEDLYDWTLDRENFDMKLVRAVMELRITGTVHLFEDIVNESRKVKDVVGMDFESGKVTYEEADRTDFRGCRAEVVPNEEIFPGDADEPDVQRQPFYFRRKVTTYESARSMFEKNPKWKHVTAGSGRFLLSEGEEDDFDDDRVEIVWYWDRPNDTYRLIINSVLITGLNDGFPYPHKMYPIAKTIAVPFADTRFYWGNSDPNLMRDEQDLDNDLWRMYVDAIKLKVKPPIGVSNTELANRDIVVPGVMYSLGMDDRVEAMKEVTQGIGQAEFRMLEMTEGQMDESTLDPVLTGQQASGDPTATEVRTIVGSAERLRGFSQAFLSDLLIQHAHLRLPNALWLFSNDDDFRKIVKDRVRVGGENDGRKVIEFADASDIPNPRQILRTETDAKKAGKPESRVYVDRNGIVGYRYHMQVGTAPKGRRGGSAKILRAWEKYRLYLQNPLFDQRRNAEMLAEAMGDDPNEVIAEQRQGMPPETAPPPQGAQPMPAMPSAETERSEII